MRNIFLGSLLAASLSLMAVTTVGMAGETISVEKSSKCGTGKCGDGNTSMKKCGDGKVKASAKCCGDGKAKKSAKCGTGKCGSAK